MALARALAVQPRVLLLDEPFGALDATVRKELRAWLRRLHDEVHVTTVFVTHDQEEAMEVAEQIVVLNEGRIEQVGLAEGPLRAARERVRDGVRGPGQRAVGALDPPARRGDPAGAEGRGGGAMIDRIIHLGFEVRVELTLGDGEQTWVQTTKGQAQELELTDGEIVWLRPNTPADTPADAP